ncbi:MAG: polysaccharide biosynthesis protein [Alphaproteobacteria bacterium]|nr:polysaccharide biosynthesis protein [Alphaproteobacteria bacterium]
MTELTARELEFLLDRPVRRLLDRADRRAFTGRAVFVTGAGGSIGSELVRQIAACGPSRLAIVDQSELALFELERALTDAYPSVPVDVVLADVSRPGAMAHWCELRRPDVVYHVAAYKHVTMAERAVCSAVEVNVLGAVRTADAARSVGARFTLVSTDKAASPRSVMGATKRLAEIAVRARATGSFQPIVVRFGNVLGSSGSVLTIMRRCIREGRPIPVTHPEATRYFMTAGEAVALVMKTERTATRAETYWLDMGAPIRIGDLAERVIALEARAGFRRVPIETIGLRPGEKHREELTSQGLRMAPTRHRRIWMARQRPADASLVARTLAELDAHLKQQDARAVLALLTRAVPDYEPSQEAWTNAEAQSPHRQVSQSWTTSQTA